MEESYAKPRLIPIHRISIEAEEGWEYANLNPILCMSRKEKEVKK